MVNECPVSKLHDGGLQRLHSADDIAVNWLEETAKKARKNTDKPNRSVSAPMILNCFKWQSSCLVSIFDSDPPCFWPPLKSCKKLLTAELLNLHSNITLNGEISAKYDIGIPNLKW